MLPESVKTKTRTILIIDDEIKILLGVRVLLERNGYKVIMCEDGPCGIKMAGEFLPDLIICDIMIPFMNGFKVRENLSANPPTKDIPFLFLSARASKADKINGLAVGADDYMTKPFDPQELVARINSIFRRQDDALREMHQQIERIQTEILHTLQTPISQMLSLRDNETEEYVRRMVELTDRLACELGMEGQALEHLRLGALLHDIGMSGIGNAIHTKPGALTDDDRKVMMTHPAIGRRILKPLGLPSAAMDLVYHHHERWDGSGYPDGLAGEKIPLPARIFAIVDVWDAITSDRPYRPAWDTDKAIRYISEQAGMSFDPLLVEKFLILIQLESKGR